LVLGAGVRDQMVDQKPEALVHQRPHVLERRITHRVGCRP
jgi:hypothetical protein